MNNFEIANKAFKELFNSLGCVQSNDFAECLEMFEDITTNPISLIYTKEREGDILRMYKLLTQYSYGNDGSLCNHLLQYHDNKEIDEKIFEKHCEEGKPIIIMQRVKEENEYGPRVESTLMSTPKYYMDEEIFCSLFNLDITEL